MTDHWHNCDGSIGLLLRWVEPNHDQKLNGGKPTWALRVADQYGARFLAVTHCPICGAKLAPHTVRDWSMSREVLPCGAAA